MSEAPQFRKLLYADIIRDGGSYEAGFETSDQCVATVFLAQTSVGGERDLRHKHLYVYRGREMPTNAVPLLSGSDAERRLLAALRSALIAERTADSSDTKDASYKLERLEQLIDFADHREPTLAHEIDAINARSSRLLAAIESGAESGDRYFFDDPYAV